MRKEQTELFPNDLEEIPQEEIHFKQTTIHQHIDPLEILLEEMIFRKQPYPYLYLYNGFRSKK